MGHTKPENLEDLRLELPEIRRLEGLLEKSPGIFYWKGAGFLHFHDKDGRRWAEVKVRGDWFELEIDFDATKSQRHAFLSRVKRAHRELTKKA